MAAIVSQGDVCQTGRRFLSLTIPSLSGGLPALAPSISWHRTMTLQGSLLSYFVPGFQIPIFAVSSVGVNPTCLYHLVVTCSVCDVFGCLNKLCLQLLFGSIAKRTSNFECPVSSIMSGSGWSSSTFLICARSPPLAFGRVHELPSPFDLLLFARTFLPRLRSLPVPFEHAIRSFATTSNMLSAICRQRGDERECAIFPWCRNKSPSEVRANRVCHVPEDAHGACVNARHGTSPEGPSQHALRGGGFVVAATSRWFQGRESAIRITLPAVLRRRWSALATASSLLCRHQG